MSVAFYKNGKLVGDVVNLFTQKEYELVLYLSFRGCFAPQEEIIEHLWGGYACNRIVSLHTLSIRKKLGDPSVIVNKHGCFRLNPEYTFVATANDIPPELK
ncbi:hypothetical protein A3K63_02970 [Candidatus Micrarchaeota archaeon RBG_16_49_10]|nr:MAG: hypothetical protein A3K63_02970 [Candidatus Micrarchaeota archaeon RBG_16_49_10]